eukprot:485723-Pelagomonas_calceolata.AAC.5
MDTMKGTRVTLSFAMALVRGMSRMCRRSLHVLGYGHAQVVPEVAAPAHVEDLAPPQTSFLITDEDASNTVQASTGLR